MKSFEGVEEDSRIEHVKLLFMEDSKIEDEEVEHSICNEDDYRSLCPLQGSYILKEEDAQDEGVDAFCEGPQLNVDHIYKDELCEMLKPFNLVLDKNGNV